MVCLGSHAVANQVLQLVRGSGVEADARGALFSSIVVVSGLYICLGSQRVSPSLDRHDLEIFIQHCIVHIKLELNLCTAPTAPLFALL